MKRLLDHLEAVQARGNMFEVFYTVVWAVPVMLFFKLLNLFGVKTK
jgi:hypothetical protein